MKTFNYYLDEVAKENGYTRFAPYFLHDQKIMEIANEANKRFTTAAIKEHLSRAAENAQVDFIFTSGSREPSYFVDRESITNIDIVLP